MKFSVVILVGILTVLVGSSPIWGQGNAGWGNLKGQIIFTGKIPKNQQIIPSKTEDRKFCEDNKIKLFRDDFLVDKKTKGLSGVFVMMYHGRDPGKGKKVSVHESYKKLYREKVIIDVHKLRLKPRRIIVAIGQDVILRNSDRVGHNIRLAAGNNAWSPNIPRSSEISLKDTIKHPGRLPQALECNMHDWMRGYILVRHEPYNVITKADGTFEIKNIPAGQHEFQFWHTRYLKLYLMGQEATGKRGVIKVEIRDGKTLDLGTLELKKR